MCSGQVFLCKLHCAKSLGREPWLGSIVQRRCCQHQVSSQLSHTVASVSPVSATSHQSHRVRTAGIAHPNFGVQFSHLGL